MGSVEGENERVKRGREGNNHFDPNLYQMLLSNKCGSSGEFHSVFVCHLR